MNKSAQEKLFRIMASMEGQSYISYLEDHIAFALEKIESGDTSYQLDLDVATQLLKEELEHD